MLPRWHIILGALFTSIVWIVAPGIDYLYLALIFFSSFLIDFDHYIVSSVKTGKLRLKHSFDYHDDMLEREKEENEKGIRKRGDFHLFHTIEFHIIIGLMSLVWIGFFYVFTGMIFHTLLDVFSSLYNDRLYRREYFFLNWLRKTAA